MTGLVENIQARLCFKYYLEKSGCICNRFFIEKMDKNQILELLKTVKYPGFNRDIVSFGMVKDIEVKENGVKIYLNISSQNDEKKQLIVNAIKSLLS